MTIQHGDYTIDDDRFKINFDVVTDWLAETYWSPGIERSTVIRAADNSAIVVGAYFDHCQVGYARIVSDTVRFSYLADVYVDEAHRRHGIAGAMVRFLLAHPDMTDVQNCVLKTRDAHALYEELGFHPLMRPDDWLRWDRPVVE